MIGPAAKLASIFSMPLGEKGGVADLMTNIMQTFNIPSQNATQVVDQLATAVTSANISLTDLAQSFQYSGAEFRNAKSVWVMQLQQLEYSVIRVSKLHLQVLHWQT